MKIVISGSSGFIGTHLVTRLQASGHDVLRLVRRSPRGPGEVPWDPAAGELDAARLQGVDAAINLAGAGVGDKRWTDEYKQLLRSSRVDSTALLSRTLATLEPRPSVLLSGSAIGFYGDRGEEELTEASARGEGFFPDLVQEWEAAADPARSAGITVATLRTGLVMGPGGGMLARLLPLLKLGLGGPLGSGRQWWSWISLPDELAAIEHLLTAGLDGPVNLTAPQPDRQKAVVEALAHRLARPAFVPAPALALRLVLGEFSSDVLSSQRVLPTRLQADDGFRFTHPDVASVAGYVAEGS